MNATDFKNFIRNTLFYEKWTCNVCKAEIFSGAFCDDCNKSIQRIKEFKCEHCGRITHANVPFCDSCKTKNLNFNRARSVYNYTHPISAVIQNFKYENKQYLGRVFAQELYSVYKEEGFSPSVITFVPMHETRLKERGYNQAELLANELSMLCGVKVEKLAEKVVKTERQANLNLQERRNNLKGTFKVYKKEVIGKDILLIDDVLTTGSTADVLSEAFKKAGANSVIVLTVASVQKQN
ncbi:MAG: ComF family protein [Clostridia bacterium]|nr:ComF family protein [Clostridia bacterium]